MSSPVNPKQFWEEKILTWEDARYGEEAEARSMLERLAARASNSVRFRLEITGKLLKAHVRGKQVVELGCGSGLIAGDLIAMGAAGYKGYDISEKAVSHARELAAENGVDDKVSFEVCPVLELPPLNGDIVFSLGLLDWLDTDSLARVFEVGGEADYLHAISEKRVTPSQYIHRLYVFLAYGWRTGSYVPKYHTVEEIEGLAETHNPAPVQVYRNARLSFSTLISTLPLES